MTDPIADMLARIRNAALVGNDEVSMPYSKTKIAVAAVLKKGGFIQDVQATEGDSRRQLVLRLSSADQSKTITEIHRISRPGQRVYVGAAKIPRILSGRGLVVVSTSSGVMSGDEARAKRLGGELMCKVW